MTWRNGLAGFVLMAAAGTSLAQAPAPVRAAQTADDTVLHAYSIPAAQLERAYADFAKQFGGERNTKIAVDRRTSQVLVVAPPGVHARIVQWLNPKPPATTQPRPVEASGPALTPVVRGPQTIRLEPKLWPSLAASLEQIWRQPLSKPTSRIGDISRYRVEFARGGEVELQYDTRQGLLVVNGPEPYAGQAGRLIEALLAAPSADGNQTKVVPVVKAPPDKLRMALTAYQTGAAPAEAAATAVRRAPRTNTVRGAQLAQLFQQPAEEEDEIPEDEQPADEGQPPEAGQPGDQPGDQPPPGEEAPPTAEDLAALLGQVRIEYIEGMDAIIITGRQADVEKVQRIIDEIEQIAAQTVPVIEVYPLEHANSEAVATMVTTLYDTMLQPRQGRVSITPLVKPNSLLLIGRRESVDSALELIKRLDQQVDPAKQFEIFRLRHASATEIQTLITQFYQQRGQTDGGGAGQVPPGLAPRVIATADYRTNSLIVQASPRDLAEVAALIQRMDDPTSAAENELRVIPLTNTMAEEMQQVLQSALTATMTTQGRGGQGGNQFQGFDGGGGQQSIVPSQGGGAAGQRTQQLKSTALRFMAIDSEGRRQLQSGVLSDVRITAEPRSNSLLVSAPSASMELLEALIKQLDQPPAAAAQVKVFTIVRGDATAMAELLQGLFGQTGAGAQGRGGQQQQQSRLVVGTGEGGGVLPVRFSVDTRTNSIIAAGSEGDLQVVEAILLRLDESDLRQRETQVYRLRNAPADAIAESVSQYLQTERQTQQLIPGAATAFEQIEREVVVVPELVSNSLIISANPRYFPDILKLVQQLDARPPMVMIQVLIAEVALNNTDEFGVELGLQDSLLFDRSFLDNISNITQSTQTSTPAGVVTNTVTQLQTATLSPGFAFNNQSLGNAVSTSALRNSGKVAGQALSNFSLNRTNNDLGFGGLVLSASSESVSILIRALQESRRLDVLSRPQIMTLDNQPAYVQVGERVPTITGTQLNETGQINNVQLEDVGLILGVTPRTSPDNLVVMEVDAQKSALGPEAEGIPVSISATGEVVRQPRIDITQAQTTVSAQSGQTIVIGGLITNRRAQVHRRVPVLASIPILGNLFRYDSVANEKTELLIILTPHVVRTKEEAELLKQVEAARMNWCLADVRKIHGYGGLRGRTDEWEDNEVLTIYPDQNLDGKPAIGPDGAPLQPSGEPTLAPPQTQPQPGPGGPAPMLGPPSGGLPPNAQPQANQIKLRPQPDPNMQRAATPPTQRPPQPTVQPVAYQTPPQQR